MGPSASAQVKARGQGAQSTANAGTGGGFSTRFPPPFVFPGPLYDGMPLGIGIVKSIGVVSGGNTVTFTNVNLKRVPIYVQVLVNGSPSYPGDCFVTAYSIPNGTVTVQFERAQTATSFVWIT